MRGCRLWGVVAAALGLSLSVRLLLLLLFLLARQFHKAVTREMTPVEAPATLCVAAHGVQVTKQPTLLAQDAAPLVGVHLAAGAARIAAAAWSMAILEAGAAIRRLAKACLVAPVTALAACGPVTHPHKSLRLLLYLLLMMRVLFFISNSNSSMWAVCWLLHVGAGIHVCVCVSRHAMGRGLRSSRRDTDCKLVGLLLITPRLP